jgi:beta-1,4-mannosyltransferase
VLTQLPGRDMTVDAWLDETFAAVARVPAAGPPPVVWAFTPFYTGNPFQAVLYSGFAQTGMVAAPAFHADDLRKATDGWPADLPLVVHVHWLNRVLAKVKDAAQADAAVDRHNELLDLLKSRAARLVWTVHNVLPHDIDFEEQEVRLRRDVLDRVDLVHVMSSRTPEMVSQWFTLPADRTYHCDHPGYQGVYPDWIGRTDARRRLRIPDGSTTLLLMGALKPYKGLSELFDAVDTVNREEPGSVTLVVAGKPDNAPETVEFIDRAARHPAVRLLAGQVPDVDVQVLFRAADVVALPYRRSLNSGVLALGLSYDRPVLLPASSGSLPLVPQASVTYDSEDPGGLLDAVRRCTPLTPELEAAAAAAGSRIHRATVTRRFAEDMRHWADTGRLPERPDADTPAAVTAVAVEQEQEKVSL